MNNKVINSRLFLFEIVFACLVILCHLDFPNGEIYIDSLGRSGVLFFFIVSAYFYNFALQKEDYTYKSTLKRCLRLLIIGVITVMLYCVVIVTIRISYYGVPKFFSDFTIESLDEFGKVYMPRLSFIWFVFALAICYLLFPLINKIKWIHECKLSIILPLAILAVVYAFRIVASKYDLGIFSKIEITRNFFFTGLPCFLIGTYIFDHRETLKQVRSAVFYPLIVALFGICILEAYLQSLVANTPNEFYLASIVVAALSCIYCIQNPDSKIGTWLYKVFGKTAYMLIYLLHILFIHLLSGAFEFDSTKIMLIVTVISCCLIISTLFTLFKKLKR